MKVVHLLSCWLIVMFFICPLTARAAEVAKDGHDLGEMNRKLLQKVEELTLYIIDLQKRIVTLEQQTK